MRTAGVVLLLATLSCSSDGAPTAAEPTAPPGETSTVLREEPLPCVPGHGPFTGPAADEFGAEKVMAAYCTLAELAWEQEDTSLALPIPQQRASDVRGLSEVLTPAARRGWELLVQARRAGDREASRRVNGLTLHDVTELPQGYADSPTGPDVFGTEVGPATAKLARGGAALSLTFTLDTALVLEEKGSRTGRHSLLPVSRRATYVLVPDGDSWLVDEWRARFSHGPVRLVSG